MELQDAAAAAASPPLTQLGGTNQQLSRAEPSWKAMQCLQTGKVPPFKGTMRRAGCREQVAAKIPPSVNTQNQNLLLSNLPSHWILMNLQFGAKTGNPHRLKEEY